MADLQPMGNTISNPLDALSGSSGNYDGKAKEKNGPSANQGQEAMEFIKENPEMVMAL